MCNSLYIANIACPECITTDMGCSMFAGLTPISINPKQEMCESLKQWCLMTWIWRLNAALNRMIVTALT